MLEMLLAGHPEMVAVGELQNLSHQIAIGRVCSCGALPKECHRWQAINEVVKHRLGVDIFETPAAFRVSRERPHSAWDHAVRLWNRSWYYLHFRRPWLTRLGLHHFVLGRRRMCDNYALVASTVRDLSGAPTVIDSSKDYVRMREIHDSVHAGKAKIIYLCRDGRGCVWSAVKRQKNTVAGESRDWAKNQIRTRNMLTGVSADNQILLRYEDLCIDVEGTMRRLCEFIGMPFDERMLDLAPSEHHTIAGNQIRVQRRMEIRSDDAWRKNLSANDLHTFDRIAGAENRRLGYAG